MLFFDVEARKSFRTFVASWFPDDLSCFPYPLYLFIFMLFALNLNVLYRYPRTRAAMTGSFVGLAVVDTAPLKPIINTLVAKLYPFAFGRGTADFLAKMGGYWLIMKGVQVAFDKLSGPRERQTNLPRGEDESDKV